jgi:hypothetical protein
MVGSSVFDAEHIDCSCTQLSSRQWKGVLRRQDSFGQYTTSNWTLTAVTLQAAADCLAAAVAAAGAFETLCSLSQGNDLVVVTSRQHVIQDLTLEWLDRHYAGLFEEVYFGNHFALQGASRKKSDICK